MPKLSPRGDFVLSFEAVGGMAADWGWLNADTAIGYRYDVEPGLYTCHFPDLAFTRLGDFDSGNRRRFFASAGRWLVDLTTGTLDSEGRPGPDDRSACAMGDRGEQVFVLKADFAHLVIRQLGGRETVIDVPGYDNSAPVTLRGGSLMWGSATGPRDASGALVGPHGAMQTFSVGPDGSRWCVGYVGGWGLCAWRWGQTRGYNLSRDAFDFYPDICVDYVANLRIVSAETQGDTRVRTYALDLARQVFRRTGGNEQPLILADLLRPPAADVRVEPFGEPKAFGPFFATSTQYGSGDVPGNFEVLVEDSLGVVDWDQQVRKRPTIADPACMMTVPLDQRLALWTAAKGAKTDYGTLARAVEAIRPTARALGLPLAVYSDTRRFDEEAIRLMRPWDLACLQVYRGQNESPDAMQIDVAREINFLYAFGWPVLLVLGFDDRGWFSDDDLLALMPVYDKLLRRPGVLGGAFFSARRPRGVISHPALAAWVEAFATACPSLPDFPRLTIPTPGPSPTPAPVPKPAPRLGVFTRFPLLEVRMSIPRVFSQAQLNDVGSGEFTVTLANPLDSDWAMLPSKGTALGPFNPDGTPQFTGPDCVYSQQPNGESQVRPKGTKGGYEKCRKVQGALRWEPEAGKVFLLPFAE